MGTSKMEENYENKDAIIVREIDRLKDKIDEKNDRINCLYKRWTDALESRNKTDEENIELKERISNLMFEKFDLEDKNTALESQLSDVKELAKQLAEGYRTALKELEDRKAWRKDTIDVKNTTRKIQITNS